MISIFPFAPNTRFFARIVTFGPDGYSVSRDRWTELYDSTDIDRMVNTVLDTEYRGGKICVLERTITTKGDSPNFFPQR